MAAVAAARRHRLRALLLALSLGRQRVFRDRLHPFELYDDEGLRRRFRFGVDGLYFITEAIRPDIERRTRRNQALPAVLQVMLALQFFATGNFLITAGDIIGVHVGTASKTVRRVALALEKKLTAFVRWPNRVEVPELQRAFYAMHSFPGVVGAIDCTHIRIQAPSQHEEAYVNRHLYHSINVQLVVDASSRIRSVVAKWPGSVHDARILAESGLAEKFDSGRRQGILLGDSGYPCRPRLMTPFRTPDTQGKLRYNRAHGTTRAVVERAIGQLKRRFHCLHTELRMRPERCCTIILACCALHNIAKQYPSSDESCDLPAEVPAVPVPDTGDGALMRNTIVQQHFSA